MSSIQKKKINGKEYIVFVKKISFMNKLKTLQGYIGNKDSRITKEKYIVDNLDRLSCEEFSFRKEFLKTVKKSLSHNLKLPGRVEMKAIKINNLKEASKFVKEIDIEFIIKFVFNSNSIEGSRIPQEIVRKAVEVGSVSYRNKNEVKEVFNSIIAYNYLINNFKFNLNSIRRLYHILTEDLHREGNISYPKGFKKEKNVVGNSTTSDPENVEEDLLGLINWYKKNKKKIHPLILAFEFHKRYEAIHPFLDGNGRTGRLIMNKILISAGYAPIIIFKDNKEAYFNALSKAREGRNKKYYQFMLEQADKSYDFILEIIKKY
jgi:Fic family protein